MIDKITPRALDKSSDYRLVPKTSMIDALNVYITDDGAGAEGNVGTLKNVRGNSSVDYATEADYPSASEDSVLKVIGSVTDSKTKICYFFVWSQTASDHGIWAYDKYGKLPISMSDGVGVPNSLRKIFTSDQFNFPEHGFVKGDVVYTNTTEFRSHAKIMSDNEYNEGWNIDFEKDALLYFTDNVNEPRKINIYRALLEKNDALAGPEYTNGNELELTDFICACPKVPLDRITFVFDADASVSTNNFAASPGFQFAYQHIYKDKTESAISVYSESAFPPSIVNRGAASTSDILAHNVCILSIPQAGPEIESIRLLARYGNSTNFFEIDEIGNNESLAENWDIDQRLYKFYNDRVASGVHPQEVNKTFDNVPRKAQAQTAISNRLIYGNYLEGFDNINTECKSKVIYNERPPDYLDLLVRTHASIEPTPYGENRCVGFQIDTTEMPSDISAGTIINAVIEYQPDKNFHIYQAHNIEHTYHQSRHMGKYSANTKGYRRYPLENENTAFNLEGEGNNVLDIENTGATLTNWSAYKPDTQANNQETGSGSSGGYRTANQSGAEYLEKFGQRFFGKNWGVGARGDTFGADWISDDHPAMPLQTPKWIASRMPNVNNVNNDPQAVYGSSAGNPLIIKSVNLSFQVRFTVTHDINSYGKKLISETICEALAGAEGNDLTHSGAVVIDELINVARIEKDDYDLGLSYTTDSSGWRPASGSFPTLGEGKDYSYLINGIGDRGQSFTHDITAPGGFGSTNDMVPRGYFIINRAEVDFYLEKVEDDELGGDAGDMHLRVCISKIDVDADDVYTCMRKLDPQSPWWVVGRETASNPEFATYFETFEEGQWGDQEEAGTFSSLFALSDPIFKQRNRHLDFSWGFNLSPPVVGPYIGDDDANIGAIVRPNALCHGYLDLTESRSLYKPHSEIFGTTNQTVCGFPNMYKPELGESRFRFSLMDGEGGPGGSFAGGNSAYDKYDNAKYGSIAGRIDIDKDENNIMLHYSIESEQACVQAYVGGSRYGDTADFGGPGETENLAFISSYGLMTDEEAASPENNLAIPGTLTEGMARFTYVVSGPFFTGSIAMNATADEGYNIQGKRYPQRRDYTTTLPLVWSNPRDGAAVQQITIAEGSGQINSGNVLYNWLKTSFPWPQTVTGQEGSWTSDGQMNSFSIDGLPFRNGIVEEFDPDTEFNNAYYGGGVDNSQYDVAPAHSDFGCVDFYKTHSHLEGGTRSMYSPSGGFENNTSFKSSATHEFGIVYYDQRGRHGYVNHLDSVYVEGYNPGKRAVDGNNSNSQGSAHVQLTLMHTPPEWAHNYKIVYSKNTSYSDFIQYSAGGAWVAQGESPGSDPSRIYVSLNYLQGHEISYSSAWGARSEEGSPVMYIPKQGDRLRIVSYMLDNVDDQNVPPRIYPYNYDFEVSDVVNLDDVDNPLADNYVSDGVIQIDENQKGLFLVLKNNNNAQGFRYQNVMDGSSYWGDNCIIELYSPVKELDADDRLYYEIGKTYDIERDANGNLVHVGDMLDNTGNPTVLLTDGDVYFRSHAVNLRDYDASLVDGTYMGYTDIIINTQVENAGTDWEDYRRSEANFKSYYLESPVATDLFKSNATHIGRPNMIKQDAQESYKEASVIHSDKDIIDHGKVSYSSFNRSIPIDKDLDMKNGEINYLGNWDDSCFFVQKDKCGYFGIDRTMISDLQGEKSLIASSKFINEPQYYLGRAGADGNPESVYIIDNSAYFAHKSLGQVFKASGGGAGAQVISDINMRTWFKDLFENAMMESMENGDDVRVVGGYDPMKQEYLLTVLSPETYGLITSPYIPDVKDHDTTIYDDGGNGDDNGGNGDDDGGNGGAHRWCNYPMLIDENGHITSSSIMYAYAQVSDMVESGEITAEESLTMLPNLFDWYGDDPVITMNDWVAAVAQWTNEGYDASNPIVCSIDGNGGDDEDDDSGIPSPLFNPCDWLDNEGQFDITSILDLFQVVGEDLYDGEAVAVDPATGNVFLNPDGTPTTYDQAMYYLIPGNEITSANCPLDPMTLEHHLYVAPVLGCTNPNAMNYNPDATVDDGSCLILGCTDPTASNYDPEATLDDGTCKYDDDDTNGDDGSEDEAGGEDATPPPLPPVRRNKNTKKPPGNRYQDSSTY